MAKVSLIDYTGRGSEDKVEIEWNPGKYAAALLVFTKNTRLNMNPDGLQKFLDMPMEELEKELQYMSTTIASSLEFLDLTFSIENVSRACAQQITRTRNASYQMQSQRVLDMSNVTWNNPYMKNHPYHKVHDDLMKENIARYVDAVKSGNPLENARGLLPLDVHCNLLAKYNFRAFVELISKRRSLRVQKEYADIGMQMMDEVLRVWPWAKIFFVEKHEKAIALLEEVAQEIKGYEGAMYKDASGKLAKAADLLKGAQ